MVGKIDILNKQIVEEQHKRKSGPENAGVVQPDVDVVDLSHTIENGMVTYKDLPVPIVCDHISHLQSRGSYAPGTEFQIGRINMVANTGTYIDTPYHRYPGAADLSTTPLPNTAHIPGVVVRATGSERRAIDWTNFAAIDLSRRAVLVNTGWDRHWRTDRYFEGHPFLTKAAAKYLRDQGAALVGIDSPNIDDTSDRTRPVHSILLAAGIPIVEHLTRPADTRKCVRECPLMVISSPAPWSGRQRGGGRKVHRHVRCPMQVVGHHFVADGYDCVYQVALRPTGSEERFDQRLIRVSALDRDLLDQPGQRIQLRVETRPAGADLEDLRVGKADLLADHGMGREAVLACVDLTDDEVDDFARLAGDAALRVLKCEVATERVLGMRHCRVQVRYDSQGALQLVEDRLVGGRDFVAGRDVDRGHSDSPDLKKYKNN